MGRRFGSSLSARSHEAPAAGGKLSGILAEPVIASLPKFLAKQNDAPYPGSRELPDRIWLFIAGDYPTYGS